MRPRFQILLIVTFILGVCACAVRLSGLQHYRNDLELRVRLQANTFVEGRLVPAILSIHNVGKWPLDFCIESDAREYEIASIDGPQGKGQFVSHPGCSWRLTLNPRHHVEWSATFDLLDTAPGAARLTTAIAVVDPLSCEGVRGCQSIMLKSDPVALHIVAITDTQHSE